MFPRVAARDVEGEEHDPGNQDPQHEDAETG